MRLVSTRLLVVYLLAGWAKAQDLGTIQGDYVEVRSGHVYTCGCLYSGEMATAGKEAILVWRVTSGTYQRAISADEGNPHR